MMEQIRHLLGRLQAEQSGAIALALLASILILFMSALIIYDAGVAAQDKMDTQIGADSAAYSHTVVKARSMNMIAYANTIKRMLFSYLATYINAWLTILARWAYHASQCFKWLPSIPSCITWAAAIPMIIAEGIEMIVTNMPSMGGIPWTSDGARSRAELHALENYSKYMFAITPWWAYVEGVLRGMTNGAMMTAAWPPPGYTLTQINSAISPIVGPIDSALGTNVMGMLPGSTSHTDVLPINRRDTDSTWSSVSDPFQYGSGAGFMAAGKYCIDWIWSMESIVTGAQTVLESNSDPSGWKTIFVGVQASPIGSIGCMFAAWSYNDDGYQDWRINENAASSKQRWLASTGSLHIAYTPRAGRNDSEDGARRKYMYMSREAGLNRSLYANEGYFAMAKSELVYKQPFQILSGINNVVQSVPLLGSVFADRLGIQESPDMWSPRWKAKNRPVRLPGEGFGSAISGSPVGLNVVVRDAVPFLALGSLIGLAGPQGDDPPFSVSSAVGDFAYLLRSGSTFGPGNIGGLAK